MGADKLIQSSSEHSVMTTNLSFSITPIASLVARPAQPVSMSIPIADVVS